MTGRTEKYIKEAWFGENKNMWYWLRSPGDYQYYAAFVIYDVGVDVDGNFVNNDGGGVRPALWVNLD